MEFFHAAVFLLPRGARNAIGLVLAILLITSLHAGEDNAAGWDLASWRDYRARMNRKPADDEKLVDELTLLRVLSSEFVAPSFERSAGIEERLALVRPEVASGVLERSVRSAVKVADSKVTKVFEAEKAALAKPKRWQLSDIMLRLDAGASEEQRRAVLDRMETIRREIAAGAAFDQVAGRESESSTRLRGGNLGVVSLDELAPVVAGVVAGLGEGDLSPVIELDSGFVLLRCAKVLEAEAPDVEKARAKIERRFRAEAANEAWELLTTRLLAGAKLEIGAEWLKQRQPGASIVAAYDVGGSGRTLTADQLQVYLRVRREARPPASLSEEALTAVIEERVLLDLREHEAVARGLVDADVEATIRWQELELEARSALDARVDKALAAPTEEQLREAYTRRKDQLVEPEMRHLRVIRVAIENDRPRAYFESVRELGTRAAAGGVSLAEAAGRLGVEVEDLGWLAPNDVWRLGRAVDDAVGRLEVGGISPAVQEGRTLLIVELAGRRDQRMLSFDESMEMLLGNLLKGARLQMEETIRQQILAENRYETP